MPSRCRERSPRRRLSVPWPLDGHEPPAEDERSLRRAVPVAGAGTAQLGVLGTDTRAELGIHHLTQHSQSCCRGEGEQPLTHRARDLGQRESHFRRRPSSSAALSARATVTTGTFLLIGDPLPGLFLAEHLTPTRWQVSGGDHRLTSTILGAASRNGLFDGLLRAGQVRFTEGQRLSDSVASGVLRATFPRWLIDEAAEVTGRRDTPHAGRGPRGRGRCVRRRTSGGPRRSWAPPCRVQRPCRTTLREDGRRRHRGRSTEGQRQAGRR